MIIQNKCRSCRAIFNCPSQMKYIFLYRNNNKNITKIWTRCNYGGVKQVDKYNTPSLNIYTDIYTLILPKCPFSPPLYNHTSLTVFFLSFSSPSLPVSPTSYPVSQYCLHSCIATPSIGVVSITCMVLLRIPLSIYIPYNPTFRPLSFRGIMWPELFSWP